MEPVNSAPTGTVLAFDFGAKRIGIAVGHTEVRQASPVTTVGNIHGRPEWEKIAKLIEQWQPVALIIGLPLTESNESQPLLPLSAAFTKNLRKRFSLPTYRSDERFSSIEASKILAENRRRGNRRKTQHADTDKIAAAIILDHWFSQLPKKPA